MPADADADEAPDRQSDALTSAHMRPLNLHFHMKTCLALRSKEHQVKLCSRDRSL